MRRSQQLSYLSIVNLSNSAQRTMVFSDEPLS